MSKNNKSFTISCHSNWDWDWYPTNPEFPTYPDTINIPSVQFTPYPVPEIKTLEIKDKILIYYWLDGMLHYSVYEKNTKLDFQVTVDFLEVLKELGLLE